MAQSNIAEGHVGSRSDEETPLLADQPKLVNGVDDDDAQNQEPEEEVVIPDEISTKKLVLVLGSVYVGVFLGALGELF